MKIHYAVVVGTLIASLVAGCASAPPASGPSSSAPRGRLVLSGNDGKQPMIDGVYKIADSPVMDTLTVLDVSAMPPKKLVDLTIQHTVVAPPMTIAVAPDEKLALVSAPNRVDPKDKTKVANDNYMQIVDLDA